MVARVAAARGARLRPRQALGALPARFQGKPVALYRGKLESNLLLVLYDKEWVAIFDDFD